MPERKIQGETSKPVTIAVLSDTHAARLADLPSDLQVVIRKADYLVHLGDFSSREILEDFKRLCTFQGVAGNHDSPEVHEELPEMKVIEVAGKRLGLIHGMIWPFGSHRRMKAWFERANVDAILYGHVHMTWNRRLGSVFLFNPGTAIGEFPGYRSSVGLLTIDGTIEGQIIPLRFCGRRPSRANVFRAWFVRSSLRVIETWPYFDLLGLLAKMRRSISAWLIK